ncbi:MAG: hypothetical protein IKJ42_10625 [Bacteroidaceae bacterium]|nr:hypothetical protein [Bacteroidaceae bacterium]
MKAINEIFWINRALPCFEVSKFTQPMSEFDTRCENLSRYMPFVMMHFQWAGAHDDEERTCSLHNLGYKLHRALVEVKAIYEKRSQQLCDEHCEQFEELMTLVQTYSWHIIHFIEEAEELFADACENNRLDKVQLRLLAQYGEICGWMKQLSGDKLRLDEAAQKCSIRGWTCNMRIFDVELTGIRHQFEAVQSSLMLLTVPYHIKSTDAEMVTLFRTTFTGFLKGEYWRECRDEYADKIADEWESVSTDKERIQLLKGKKRQVKDDIRQLLAQFDVSYVGTDTDERTCKLARRLYERLNNVHFGRRGKALKPMNNNDLCRYLILEGKMHYLSDEIARLESQQQLHITNSTHNNGYFIPEAPRDLVRQAIYAVIHHHRGDGRLLLSAQSHWIAIYKVLEETGYTCGTMRQFCELMQVWFSSAEHPCSYDSLKNISTSDVKKNPYSAWQRHEPRNRAFLAVADELVRQMQELKVA